MVWLTSFFHPIVHYTARISILVSRTLICRFPLGVVNLFMFMLNMLEIYVIIFFFSEKPKQQRKKTVLKFIIETEFYVPSSLLPIVAAADGGGCILAEFSFVSYAVFCLFCMFSNVFQMFSDLVKAKAPTNTTRRCNEDDDDDNEQIVKCRHQHLWLLGCFHFVIIFVLNIDMSGD